MPYRFFFSTHFGLSWIVPRRVVELFACWWTIGSTRSVSVWKMVPFYLLWYLWKERNNISFEDCERMLVEVKSFFFYTLCLWTTAFVSPLLLSLFFC